MKRLHDRKARAVGWKHIVEKRKVGSIAHDSSLWNSLECIPMSLASRSPVSNCVISCCLGATESGSTICVLQDDFGCMFPNPRGSCRCPTDETVVRKWVIELNAGGNWSTSKSRRSAWLQLYRAKVWRWNRSTSLATNNETITPMHKHIERSIRMIETIRSFPSPKLGIRTRTLVEYHVRIHR